MARFGRYRRLDLFITDPQFERLKALSARTGLNRSELVRRAIDEMLHRESARGRGQRRGGNA